MLATLLLLAQLVLPWPGLDSPLVQPGPTICVGECAGPVIYGPAERGRLVVACDMTSDTCSDGRQITTTRATPVPCETSPGVWEMVPAGQGCYSVRGLESWAANTSYMSWGAELDRSPWRLAEGATLEKLEHGYRLAGATSSSRIFQSGFSPEEGVWTLSCIMRTSGSQNPRLRIYQEGASGGGFCALDSSDAFSTYSCTKTVTGTPTVMGVHIYPGSGYVDVAGCWVTKTDTPGRACWGGEAPVTCDADSHSISTDGWPTEAGEVCITAALETMSSWNSLFRDPVPPSIRLEARLNSLELNGLSPANLQLSYSPPLELSRTYTYCAGRRKDGKAWLGRNGTFLGESEVDPFTWSSAVDLGRTSHWSGSISSLRVRSFE